VFKAEANDSAGLGIRDRLTGKSSATES